MKYDKDFIRAVHVVGEHVSPDAAERLFNKLFGTPPSGVRPTGYHAVSVDRTCRDCGKPDGLNVASWVTRYRLFSGHGLRAAKDVYNFIRDHPNVVF